MEAVQLDNEPGGSVRLIGVDPHRVPADWQGSPLEVGQGVTNQDSVPVVRTPRRTEGTRRLGSPTRPALRSRRGWRGPNTGGSTALHSFRSPTETLTWASWDLYLLVERRNRKAADRGHALLISPRQRRHLSANAVVVEEAISRRRVRSRRARLPRLLAPLPPVARPQEVLGIMWPR